MFNSKVYQNIFVNLLIVGLFANVLSAQSLEEKQWVANGNAFYLKKDFDKARVEYSKAVTQMPSWYKANYNLGNAYYELKQYKQAVSHYQKATQTAEEKMDKAHAFHNLGNAMMQQREFKKAIEAYKNALRLNPKDNETRYNFVLAKKLLNNQQNKQNPPDLPKPSEFAKQAKAKADSLSAEGKFQDAFGIMNQAMKRDSTVAHFGDYINKLNEVIVLDTIQLK